MDLVAMLADPSLRQRVIKEGAALVDAEVAKRSGMAGIAIRTGFAAIKKIRPDIVEDSLDKLLPAFAPAIQPHVAAGEASGGVASYFSANASRIADDLLAVTDAKAQNAQNAIMKRTYATLRGQAHKQTTQSVPAVGAWLQTYVDGGIG